MQFYRDLVHSLPIIVYIFIIGLLWFYEPELQALRNKTEKVECQK